MAPKSVKVKPAKATTTKKTTTKPTGTKKAPTKKSNEESSKPAPKMTDLEKEEMRKQIHQSIEERLKNGTFFPKAK